MHHSNTDEMTKVRQELSAYGQLGRPNFINGPKLKNFHKNDFIHQIYGLTHREVTFVVTFLLINKRMILQKNTLLGITAPFSGTRKENHSYSYYL